MLLKLSDILRWICPPSESARGSHPHERYRIRITQLLFPTLLLGFLIHFFLTITNFDAGQSIISIVIPYSCLLLINMWLCHHHHSTVAAGLYCAYAIGYSMYCIIVVGQFHLFSFHTLILFVPLIAIGNLIYPLVLLAFDTYHSLEISNQQLVVELQDVTIRDGETSVKLLALDETYCILLDELGCAERENADYQTVLATVREGIIIIDSQEGTKFTNSAYEHIIGLSYMVQSEGKVHLLSEDGTALPFEQWPYQRVLRGEWADPPTTYQIITPTGERKMILIEAVPLEKRGENRRVLGVVRDITVEYREARNGEILQNLGHKCAESIDTVAVAQAAIDVLFAHFLIGNATIIVRDALRPHFAKVIATRNGPEFSKDDIARLIKATEMMPIADDAPLRSIQVIATGLAQFNQTPLVLPEVQGIRLNETMHSVAYLPLKVGKETFGVLVASFTTAQDRIWDSPDQWILQSISEEMSLALHRARLYEATQRLALYDPLTGLRNHRALQQLLQHEVTVTAKLGLTLSVIMLDVDHFRRFNETYGHDLGDRALQLVAQAINSAIRETDYAARYGGEEFTIILPGTDGQQAIIIAERVRAAIEAVHFSVAGINEELSITASLGFASFPEHASVPSSLLKAADLALYDSKHQGRNRVTQFLSSMAAGEVAPSPLPSHATIDMVQALITSIDLRDGFTASHSEGVARFASAIAVHLQMSTHDVEMLHIAGLVHDIGKIAVPETILMKHGPLTDKEWTIMKQHTIHGERLLADVEILHEVLYLVRSHHERLDGSGYPDGLGGESIPLLLRILSVADVFEAYTAVRPYHAGRTTTEGLLLLKSEVLAGRLEASVVAAFSEIIQAQRTEHSEDILLVA